MSTVSSLAASDRRTRQPHRRLPASHPAEGSADLEPVELLWTGGWDSTFRLLQLTLVEQRTVQPIYVIDPERRSLGHELRAMVAIREAAIPRLPGGVRIEPARMYVRTDFPDPPHLGERFSAIARRAHIGRQYLWLASVADALGWADVEMCIPKHELPSGLQDTVFTGIRTGSPRLKDTWEAELFRYWTFPVLTTTKAAMGDVAAERGFRDVLELRWFCLLPAGRHLACGRCRPCRIARRDGATGGVAFANRVQWYAQSLARKLRRGRGSA